MIRYGGNCPRNVSRDAKYAMRWFDGKLAPSIVYRHPSGEQWLASTDQHPALADMLNAASDAMDTTRGGPFYINEFRQVIKPFGPEADYHLVGEYQQRLEFEFEDNLLSGDARTLDGSRIAPGQEWAGPHPGVPYVLAASLKDIYYQISPRPNVTMKLLLSQKAGELRAREVASQVFAVKQAAGRFYVNEFQQIFAPIGTELPVRYVYIGGLDLGAGWFAKWSQAD